MRELLLKIPREAHGALAILALLISSVTLGITIVDTDGDGKPDSIEVTVNSTTPAGVKLAPADTEVSAPTAQVKAAGVNLEDGLRVAPAIAPPPTQEQLDRVDQLELARPPPGPTGGAVSGFAGCATRIIPTNWSSVRSSYAWQVLHYTVSHNTPGWGDVNSIIALFSNPGRQASSNFVIDAEGHCAYIVPITGKAWTQAGGNPWSISYEIIAYGNETVYLPPAGLAKLKSVMAQVAARTQIPQRRGSVTSGCTPGTRGIVQHKDFGLCGGGHVDITPFNLDLIVRAVTGPSKPPNPLTRIERRLVAHACKPAGTGHSRAYWQARARRQAARLARAAHRHHSWRYHDVGARRARLAKAAAGRC